MKREIIISIFVIVLVILLEYITANYTSNTVYKLSEDINNLKDKIINKEYDLTLEEDVKKIENDWIKYHKKLSCYLEHDELEKVETKFSRVKGYIELEKYEDSLPELEEMLFVLRHIKEKEKLSLESIF